MIVYDTCCEFCGLAVVAFVFHAKLYLNYASVKFYGKILLFTGSFVGPCGNGFAHALCKHC